MDSYCTSCAVNFKCYILVSFFVCLACIYKANNKNLTFCNLNLASFTFGQTMEEDIRAYVIWGLGSFARVSGDQMNLFICLMAILLPLSFLLIKTMNLLLLGESYARNLGLNIKRARLMVIGSAGILTAIVTAYCGPISFLGLAVPHLCRGIFQTSDHRILMPASLLVGASLALVCNLIARMPGFEGALPVNSVTALIGAPVVMSVLFNKRKESIQE